MSSFDKQKRKRRSKNDQEGRMFKCECGKAYLSALALSNHRKSKHTSVEPSIKHSEESKDDLCRKRRGRPKKHDYKFNNFPEIRFGVFFENEFRRNNILNESKDIKRIIKQVSDDLFTPSEMFPARKKKSGEYPLIKIVGIKLNKDSTTSHLTCDQIFVKYIEEVSQITNDEYFTFVVKFIILFRECINKYKNVELENSILILNEKVPKDVHEFTQFYDAEQMPELCNEFISDYLASNNYFGSSTEYISEFIPITQHFCYWLFQNNYTSSRLSLV